MSTCFSWYVTSVREIDAIKDTEGNEEAFPLLFSDSTFSVLVLRMEMSVKTTYQTLF